jgi:serine/threonine-protein kinase
VEESIPAAIILDRSEYVGRPVDEVRKDLAALGLEVDEQTSNRWGRPGRVVDLSPTQVRPGDTVTVFVPGESQRRPKKQGPKHDDDDEDRQGDDT